MVSNRQCTTLQSNMLLPTNLFQNMQCSPEPAPSLTRSCSLSEIGETETMESMTAQCSIGSLEHEYPAHKTDVLQTKAAELIFTVIGIITDLIS